MARHELVKRRRRRLRFAHYLSARQLLHRRFSAATPVRFLEKLGLLSSPFWKHDSPGVGTIQHSADFFNPYGEAQAAQPAVPAVLDGTPDPVSELKTAAVSSAVESTGVVPVYRPMIPVTNSASTLPARPSVNIVRGEETVYRRAPIAKPDLSNSSQTPAPVSRPVEHVADRLRESQLPEPAASPIPSAGPSVELGKLPGEAVLEAAEKDVQTTRGGPKEVSSQNSQQEIAQPASGRAIVSANRGFEAPPVTEAELTLLSSEPTTVELELPLFQDRTADQESPKFAEEHFADLSLANSSAPESSTAASLPEDLADVDRLESASVSENLDPMASKSDLAGELAQEDEPGRVVGQPPVSAGPTQRRARIEEVSATQGRSGKVNSLPPRNQEAQPSTRQKIAEPMLTSNPDIAVEKEAVRAEELFAPIDQVDRAPAAWAARLTEAFRPQTTDRAQTTSSVPAPRSPLGVPQRVPGVSKSPKPARVPPSLPPVSMDQPEVLPQSAARFLKPLVGIEPASVPLYRGSVAAKITAASRADAIAMGEAILLKPGYASDSHELLGVMAHELTHVVRQRQPRFVPPIARDAGTPARNSAELLDEEGIAQRVEARVIQAAKSVATADSTPVGSVSPDASVDVVNKSMKTRSYSMDEWGGLPAPWEPLPDWVTTISESHSSPTVSSAGLAAASSATMSAGGGEEAVPIQRAEEGRPVAEGNQQAAAPAPGAAAEKQAPPDLDALARQVYDVLRRRLGAEQRRELA